MAVSTIAKSTRPRVAGFPAPVGAGEMMAVAPYRFQSGTASA